MIQDQALANERLAEFHYRKCQERRQNERNKKDVGDVRIDNIDEAMYRFGEAKRLYKEWGADAVVKRVEQRCGHLFEK